MILDLIWAIIAAVVLGVISVVFDRPRSLLAAWTRRLMRHIQMKLYLEHRENTQRAIERIAAELAQRRCDQEGNPDDEFWSDWYRWFTGDPDANMDYERKQRRDLERMSRGEFGPRPR
jgi:hypothetical protein